MVPKSSCSGVLLLCDPRGDGLLQEKMEEEGKKNVKGVGQVHLHMQLSGFRECTGQDNMDSQSLLTADHWQTWGISQDCLHILSPPWQLQM